MVHQDLIDASLNLASVMGIALIQKFAIPYVCVKNQHLNEQQQQTLACLLGNVVENIPDGLKAFEFQVMDYYAYAYQLQPQITFVILAHQQDVCIKLLTAQKLQPLIEESEQVENLITFFKTMATEQQETEAVPAPSKPEPVSDRDESSIEQSVQDLNDLSQAVVKYLGPQLTANYWQTSRPEYAWINNFEITPSAKIQFSGDLQASMSAVNHLCLRQWTNAFIKQCSQIIQDLPHKIEQYQTERGNKLNLSIVPTGNLARLAQLTPTEDSLFWN